MLIGYARVSTHEQNLELQHTALEAAGCEQIYSDKVSGTRADRPELRRALEHLRDGDTLVVWRLDRLGRSLKHLIEVVTELNGRGVGFGSIQESMDTSSSGGKLIFHVFGAIAEFERDLIRERTNAGLAAARARGKKGGRPLKLKGPKLELLYELYDKREKTVAEICQALGISKPTLYDYLARRDESELESPRRKARSQDPS